MHSFDDPKFAPARHWFVKACWHSRQHSALAEQALNRFGDHGPLISGCVRDHFPDHVKTLLRSHAARVTKCSEEAHARRPKYARKSTMVQLGRHVATANGSGFYGPQPIR